MAQRRTQKAEYWIDDFHLEEADLEHLYHILLERETPLSADEMALALVRYRVEEEEANLEQQAKPKDLYRPAESYAVGDTITFPQFDRLSGEVVATREGQNPQQGTFTVLTVELENGDTVDVACELTAEHVLNFLEEEEEVEDEDLIPPEELFIEYGGYVAEEITERLDEHEDLVRLAGRWFPKSLLVEVNVGHLNLAEAVLDIVGGGPLSTPEILDQIGMLDDVNPHLAEFSLNYGLQEDDRFDEVGAAGQVLWYLVRMEPDDVREAPERLDYEPIPYDPAILTDELRDLELEIEDEHSDIPVKRGVIPERVTLTLTYPHRRAGTLPLSALLRRMFPTAYEAPRIRFTLVDPESEEDIPAWVVRPGGYVYGLEDWFEEHGIPVGGYLTVERTDVGGRVKITYAARNPRKEWVRTAVVDGNRLRFENQQITLGCEYDELMLIHVEDVEAVDRLWQQALERDTPLEQIMLQVGEGLAAFNPQSNIHAKTLYSVVNVIRRSPPGPIFSRLIEMPQFEHVGGPYWRLTSPEDDAAV